MQIACKQITPFFMGLGTITKFEVYKGITFTIYQYPTVKCERKMESQTKKLYCKQNVSSMKCEMRYAFYALCSTLIALCIGHLSENMSFCSPLKFTRWLLSDSI